MKHIGGSRYRITLEDPVEVKNAIGGTDVTYQETAKAWAYRRHRSGTRQFNGAIEVNQDRFEYFVPWNTPVTDKTRIVDDGRSFTISTLEKNFDHIKIICENSSSQTHNK